MKAELEHHYAWTTKADVKTEERAEGKKKTALDHDYFIKSNKMIISLLNVY